MLRITVTVDRLAELTTLPGRRPCCPSAAVPAPDCRAAPRRWAAPEHRIGLRRCQAIRSVARSTRGQPPSTASASGAAPPSNAAPPLPPGRPASARPALEHRSGPRRRTGPEHRGGPGSLCPPPGAVLGLDHGPGPDRRARPRSPRRPPSVAPAPIALPPRTPHRCIPIRLAPRRRAPARAHTRRGPSSGCRPGLRRGARRAARETHSAPGAPGLKRPAQCIRAARRLSNPEAVIPPRPAPRHRPPPAAPFGPLPAPVAAGRSPAA